jgi:acyl-CoA synthetase (NDP forming)
VDNANEVFLASNAFEPGSVALLSQSGNLALELQGWFSAFKLGFSRFVSIGNQADITLIDLIESSVDDPMTEAIAIYVEDFHDGRGFIQAARRAYEVRKPVVVLAAGSSASAARSAQSHTGALTSDRQVIEAACRLAGVALVNTPRELMIALQAGLQPRRANGSRVAVVTDGGGHATVASDLLEARGFTVPALSPSSQTELRSRLWAQSTVVNPVDLAGYGEQDPNSYADVVTWLLQDPDVDSILISGYFGGYSSPTPFAQGLDKQEISAARTMAETVRAQSKPLCVHTMYPDSPAIAELSAVGVPAHYAIEDAVASLAHSRNLTLGALPDEVELQLPIDGITYCDLMPLILSKGIATPEMRVVHNREEVMHATNAFTGPFVLKANGLLHKTDVGGVALNLPDGEALLREFDRMRSEIGAASYSIERMVDSTNGVEIIVGITQDQRFGAVLLVGLGGVLTEVLKDSVLALAPVDAESAREMLLSLKGAPLLMGHRGRPPVDLESAAKAIAVLSRLGAAHPEWQEFEINPLLVTPIGATALDVRVAL